MKWLAFLAGMCLVLLLVQLLGCTVVYLKVADQDTVTAGLHSAPTVSDTASQADTLESVQTQRQQIEQAQQHQRCQQLRQRKDGAGGAGAGRLANCDPQLTP